MTYKSNNRIAELDGVRGCAILMVLIWHYINCQGAHSSVPFFRYLIRITSFFWSGVDLFFVLSGFLIGGILWRMGDKPGFFRRFYLRRAARILPVYFLLLFCFFSLQSFFFGGAYTWLFSSSIPDWTYLFFLQNIAMGLKESWGGHFLAVTWSLAVEEQFYILAPVLFYVFKKTYFPYVCLVLLFLAPALRFLAPGFHTIVNTLFRMDALLSGVLLALCFNHSKTSSLLAKYQNLMLSIWFALALALSFRFRVGGGREGLDPTVIAWFYTLFIGLVLLNQGKKSTQIMRGTPLRFLGCYSYGIYMYHEAIAGLIHGFFRLGHPSVATFHGAILTLISLLLTFLLSFLSFHIFEQFFLKQTEKFSNTHSVFKVASTEYEC